MRFTKVCLKNAGRWAGATAAAMALVLAAGPATAQDEEEDDGFYHLDLRGAEGFEELEFLAVSRGKPGRGQGGGSAIDGLVTTDRKNGTTAEVTPDVSTDATGVVSGILTVVVKDDEGTTVTTQEVPASGRTRLMIHTVDRPGPGPEQTRVKQSILLRARKQGDDGNAYRVNLNATSPFGHGAVNRFGVDLRGKLQVLVGGEHRGMAGIGMAPFELSFAEFLISKDTATTSTMPGRVHGDAVVDSESLGMIAGGTSRIFFNYSHFNNAGRQVPGRYNIQARNGKFRYIEHGLLGTTKEEAEEAGGDPEVILEDSVPRFIHMTSPSALNITRVVGPPRL